MIQKKTKVTVLFWLNKSRGTDTMAPLWCRVSIRGQRYNFSTNYKVPPELWQQDKQTVSKKCKDYRHILEMMEQTRTEIRMWATKILEAGEVPTCERFKFDRQSQREDYRTILSLFDYHAAIEAQNLKPASMKHYRNTRKHITGFLQVRYHVSDIDVRKIKTDFINEFVAYLKGWKRDNPRYICTQNGAMKNLVRLNRVLNMALDNGWIESNPLARYKKKLKPSVPKYLTAEELQRLEAIADQLEEPARRVLDAFLFCTYTGLCYADARKLGQKDITTGIDGQQWVRYTRQKTEIQAIIPLLDPARRILERYAQFAELNEEHRLLPLPCNQVTNRLLKDIAQTAGLDKPLTFHMARHTFATTVTLLNNVPIETVSAMLGHQKISTTQIYARAPRMVA